MSQFRVDEQLTNRIKHDMMHLQSALNIQEPVTDIGHCTSSFFVHIADRYFGILSEIRKPDSHENKAFNISVIIRHLEDELKLRLEYINPDAVARQDLRHMSYLLDVFVLLVQPPASQTIAQWQSNVIPPKRTSSGLQPTTPVPHHVLEQIDAKLGTLERAVQELEGRVKVGGATAASTASSNEPPVIVEARRRLNRFMKDEKAAWRSLFDKYNFDAQLADERKMKEMVRKERDDILMMRKVAREEEKAARLQAEQENQAVRTMYDNTMHMIQESRREMEHELIAQQKERRTEWKKQQRELVKKCESERRALATVRRSYQEKRLVVLTTPKHGRT